MNSHSFFSRMVFLLFFFWSWNCRTPASPVTIQQAPEKIRIACLGDSITAGARVDEKTESYPAQLQQHLGKPYLVKNFGIGGATLLKSGRPNVWQVVQAVHDFQPHLIVISLGTNDTVSGKRKNWEQIEKFENDYFSLIDRFSKIPTRPSVVICTPTAMVLETPGLTTSRRANLEERKPRLQHLCHKIREIARNTVHKKVTLLELNPVLQNHPQWLTAKDGVHPNSAGYDAIARTVAKQIRTVCNQQANRKRPNIVLFLVDDMGWQDTSVPFGSTTTELNRTYRTPNMAALAKIGMKFSNAYACCVCSPTRVSLMTGLNASRHRVTNWTLRKNGSNDQRHPQLDFPKWNVNGISPVPGIKQTVYAKALPAFLQDAGYRTIHVGKAHFGALETPGADPVNIGFDVNIGGHAAGGPGSFLGKQNFSAAWRSADRVWDVPHLEAYHGKDVFLTEALTQEANREMDEAVREGDPFFLYLSHYAVHVPFAKDPRYYQSYLDSGMDPKEAMYAAMIEGMDKSLGDILANVTKNGQQKNTIILFVSDNGGLSAQGRGGKPHTHNRPLSSGKGSAHEGGIRVPMIGYWPGVTPRHSLCSQPVIIEDFFPTILELAGIENPIQIGGKLDGLSFTSLLQGHDDERRKQRPLIWHFPNHWGPAGPGIGPSSSVRQGPWKLIYYYAQRKFELFNLAEDQREVHNLAKEFPTIKRKLATTLQDYLKQANAQFPSDKTTGELLSIPQGLP